MTEWIWPVLGFALVATVVMPALWTSSPRWKDMLSVAIAKCPDVASGCPVAADTEGEI